MPVVIPGAVSVPSAPAPQNQPNLAAPTPVSPLVAPPAVSAMPALPDGMFHGTPSGALDINQMLSELESSLETGALRENVDRILMQLHDNPDQCDLLRDEDIGLLVEACGRARDNVVQNKEVRKTRKSKKAQNVADLSAQFATMKF